MEEEEGDQIAAQLEQGNKLAAPDAIEKKRTCAQDGQNVLSGCTQSYAYARNRVHMRDRFFATMT